MDQGYRLAAIATALLLITTSSLLYLYREEKTESEGLVPVWERYKQPYDLSNNWSKVLEEGPYGRLPDGTLGTRVFIEVDLPLEEGGAAVDPTNVPKMSVAYWLPPNMSAGEKVPVIMEIGPYFKEVTDDVEVAGPWLGKMIVEELLPHGYAFAQASVFGTGSSTHCMDLMGTAEQLGINAVVTWLAEQEWSNGNVAMIGKSYDGSTPWEAATFGNPALKTIVPISGLIGVMELMWRNGSAEDRAPFMHNVVYGYYGIAGDSEDSQVLFCDDYLTGWAHATGAVLWGSEVTPEQFAYWKERYFLQRVLDNYEGSVYLVQGFQDWNVDPHMAVPVINQLQDAGIEAKGLFGQWTHDYPDRQDKHYERTSSGKGREAFPYMTRYDWMQDLLEWFNYYLKENGPKPALHVEVQDNMGNWRIEQRYPAEHLKTIELRFGQELTQTTLTNTVLPFDDSVPASYVVYESQPFDEEVRFGYLPQLHVNVRSPNGAGQLFAYLEDATDNLRLGHAVMDIRYHDGSDNADPRPATWVNAKMEFLPMDVILPAGHSLRLTLAARGEDYDYTTSHIVVEVEEDAESVLRLPLVDHENKLYFTPPKWWEERELPDS